MPQPDMAQRAVARASEDHRTRHRGNLMQLQRESDMAERTFQRSCTVLQLIHDSVHRYNPLIDIRVASKPMAVTSRIPRRAGFCKCLVQRGLQ